MKARISTLARKVEELEGKRLHEVQAVTEKILHRPIHAPIPNPLPTQKNIIQWPLQ